MKKLLLLSLLSISIVGCTDNVRTRLYGGQMTINLPSNTKLINATWKEAELWYLYRPMRSNEVAETTIFQEKSSIGMIQGSVKFIEKRD